MPATMTTMTSDSALEQIRLTRIEVSSTDEGSQHICISICCAAASIEAYDYRPNPDGSPYILDSDIRIARAMAAPIITELFMRAAIYVWKEGAEHGCRMRWSAFEDDDEPRAPWGACNADYRMEDYGVRIWLTVPKGSKTRWGDRLRTWEQDIATYHRAVNQLRRENPSPRLTVSE
jgi:hypothetical protein